MNRHRHPVKLGDGILVGAIQIIGEGGRWTRCPVWPFFVYACEEWTPQRRNYKLRYASILQSFQQNALRQFSLLNNVIYLRV